jgi:serine O-acetyltransferase
MQNAIDFLSKYVSRQLANLIPDGFDSTDAINEFLPAAFEQTRICLVPNQQALGGFDYLVSWHYAILLYHLSRQMWLGTGRREQAVRLFLLNKSLNGLDLFYEVELGRRFIIGHTVGAVFAKATYGDYGVFHQGCTVGRQDNKRPVLENGVVMFPGSRIIGDCRVRENTVLAPGVNLVNTSTPGDCIVFTGEKGRPIFKPLNEYYADRYFLRRENGQEET